MKKSPVLLAETLIAAALLGCAGDAHGPNLSPGDSPSLVKAGDAQVGVAGFALADSITVRAVDGAGRPVRGHRIAWQPAAGMVSPEIAHTDDAGFARTQWTLPAAAGAVALVAQADSMQVPFTALATQQPAFELEPGGNRDLNEGVTDYNRSLRPLGLINAAMIFVDFVDAPQSENTTSLFEMIAVPARDYFDASSFGRMQLEITPFNKWYPMPRPAREYNPGFSYQTQLAYLEDAIDAATADIDFSPFDVVYVVAANTPHLPNSPTFTVRRGLGVSTDGVELRQAVTFGADTRIPMGYGALILAHETGHIFGAPDLYAFAASSSDHRDLHRYVGGWDLMGWVGGGADFFAWHKYKFGWLQPTEVLAVASGSSVEAVIDPIELGSSGLQMVVAPVSAARAVVIEVRQIIGNDARRCDQGVLVYVVDAETPTGAGPVVVVTGQDDADAISRGKCSAKYNAPLDIGPGEVSSISASGVTVEVVGKVGQSYRVRVRR